MDETRVTFTLNRLVSVLNSHADAILRARFDMTFSQFLFLVSLGDSTLSLTDLARRLEVSTAAVSKRVGWFEERGLVKTLHDPHNARKVLLSLTAQGGRLVEKAAADLDEAFTEKFAHQQGFDLGELNRNLNRVLEHLVTVPKESK